MDVTAYLHDIFTKGLKSLTHILQVAEAHAKANNLDFDVEYLSLRLADDMRPLSFQIQNATAAIKLHLARLTGDTYPVWDDSEKSLTELYNRIETTKGFLDGADWAKVKERLDAGAEVEM